ncbi:MAG: hypothetical protein K2J67_04560 [Lachnospiraceae bacterium]|nr:hypothetical protein [Lachnospiraceae bacterium]
MNIKFKYFISIILSLAVVVGTAMIVSAVEPRYSDTHSVTVRLMFDGTTAVCEAEVEGATGTTSITNGHLTLKDSRGNVVGDWSNKKSYTTSLSISESVSGLTKGETYTLSFSANVNRNGKAEPVSGSKTMTCPK